jgi:hypothetical protein
MNNRLNLSTSFSTFYSYTCHTRLYKPHYFLERGSLINRTAWEIKLNLKNHFRPLLQNSVLCEKTGFEVYVSGFDGQHSLLEG